MAKKTRNATDVPPMKPGKTAEEHESNKKTWEEEIKGDTVPMVKPELYKVIVLKAKTPESQEAYQKRVNGVVLTPGKK